MHRQSTFSKLIYAIVCILLIAVMAFLFILHRREDAAFQENRDAAARTETGPVFEAVSEAETRKLSAEDEEKLEQAQEVVEADEASHTSGAVASERTTEADTVGVQGRMKTSGVSAGAENATDTAGTEKKETVETTDPQAPVLTLKSKTVTVQRGENVSLGSYVDEITDDSDNIYDLWRDIQVEGDYDTNTPGRYTLRYSVTDSTGRTSPVQTLTLIVTG